MANRHRLTGGRHLGAGRLVRLVQDFQVYANPCLNGSCNPPVCEHPDPLCCDPVQGMADAGVDVNGPAFSQRFYGATGHIGHVNGGVTFTGFLGFGGINLIVPSQTQIFSENRSTHNDASLNHPPVFNISSNLGYARYQYGKKVHDQMPSAGYDAVKKVIGLTPAMSMGESSGIIDSLETKQNAGGIDFTFDDLKPERSVKVTLSAKADPRLRKIANNNNLNLQSISEIINQLVPSSFITDFLEDRGDPFSKYGTTRQGNSPQDELELGAGFDCCEFCCGGDGTGNGTLICDNCNLQSDSSCCSGRRSSYCQTDAGCCPAGNPCVPNPCFDAGGNPCPCTPDPFGSGGCPTEICGCGADPCDSCGECEQCSPDGTQCVPVDGFVECPDCTTRIDCQTCSAVCADTTCGVCQSGPACQNGSCVCTDDCPTGECGNVCTGAGCVCTNCADCFDCNNGVCEPRSCEIGFVDERPLNLGDCPGDGGGTVIDCCGCSDDGDCDPAGNLCCSSGECVECDPCADVVSLSLDGSNEVVSIKGNFTNRDFVPVGYFSHDLNQNSTIASGRDTIISCSLLMTVSNVYGRLPYTGANPYARPLKLDVYELNVDLDPATVSCSQYAAGQAWTSASGRNTTDRSATPVSSIVVPIDINPLDQISFDVTQVARNSVESGTGVLRFMIEASEWFDATTGYDASATAKEKVSMIVEFYQDGPQKPQIVTVVNQGLSPVTSRLSPAVSRRRAIVTV